MTPSTTQLLARHRALTGRFFRLDDRGRYAEADRLAPAIERVQRALDRALCAGGGSP